ncbi:fat-like cadherin-related tumor suppressor homolog isoform X2 [Drosophila grimshawi]|uniref:fat-like cadherin-related tumor suppressor homolog isoform X2 n=1 Tax=Drosophila grimshawi TaxID=7222 RepID=UPI000C86F20B|nr:fat-like cadherin-related tumor suppressor homolog isoform X2 [Drosophila grimshawi]
MFNMHLNKYAQTVKRKKVYLLQWTSIISCICLIQPALSTDDGNRAALSHHRTILDNKPDFSHQVYNVTIPENSLGKTYAKGVLHEDLAGISINSNYNITYRIISGDKDKLFKAEERLVGNFAFLNIRTRTSNVVLNREKTDEYILKIRAHINHSHGKNISRYETETTIHVQVLDRNDLSPLFYPTEYAVTVPEDTPKHHSILKVIADDADLGVNGEIYYSFLIDSESFAVHPTTGDITILKQLNYAENSHYELTVLANDRGCAIHQQNHQASKAKVSITVKQVNLNAPEIYAKTFSSVIPNSGALIYGIVKINDKDIGKNGEIRKLEITDGNPDGTFQLLPAEAKDEYYIELNKFASLNEQQFAYNLTLRAEDFGIPSRSTFKTVTIHILPEIKNVPIFTQEIYEVSIPETAPVNMPVIRLKVSDPDLGKYALVYLEVVGGNEGGEFRINPDSGMLYTQKRLDAETKSSYTLTVSAIDQADVGSRKQSSAKVKITVEDMNDNDPIFENINRIIYINENELAGSIVTKLTAKDKDSGENAYISYSIANLNEVPFEIDHFSGVIKTTNLIDYETMRRNYTLLVRASDWGLPYRRQTEIAIDIIVQNINDNRPQFERVNCYGKVIKSASIGSEVFTISAIDLDVGDEISYRSISGNEDGCFNLDSTTGTISIGCNLLDVGIDDRIIRVISTDGTHFSDELSINVHLGLDHLTEQGNILHGYGSFECRETGVARRLAETLALAEKNNVRNVSYSEVNNLALTPSRYGQNIHRPELLNFPQELTLNESIQLGTTVAVIEARDRDLGYNGKLVFAIADGDFDSVFRIDPDSGELQIIGYLDRERLSEYILNITVYDLGHPAKSDSKILPITITDANDNPPVLQKSLATLRLTENAPKGSIVYCAHATDADVGINAEITYSLSVEFKEFTINKTTGCIVLSKSLDREHKDKYELHIVVKDRGSPVLSTEAIVYILVDDVNDNAPIFGVQEYMFKVREDVPRGTVVAVIEAIDKDLAQNAEILFSLKEDTQEKNLFKIDKHSGAIRTEGYLDYENRQVHNLVISAIDCGIPSLTADMPIVIEIIDVNENRFAPEFEDFVFEGKIRENMPKGTLVMKIAARDMDGMDLNSKISYSITGGDGLGIFSVNDQGSIHSLTQLDAESKNFYWLTLCAQDNAIVPFSNCVKVYIEVENENDNIPLTTKPVYYVNVTEGSSGKNEIIQLKAVDPDIDPSQKITYSIISGNLVGYFDIDPNTGVLKTTERKLDRENQAEHILEVSISDNGSPILTSTTRVVVSVLDINDNSPVFDQRVYKVQVPSTTYINESIFQVHAIDNDDGENGRITYSIKSGKKKNKFRIDSYSGHIFSTKPLEPDSEFEINVKAEDNGIPKRSQTTLVHFGVIPVSPNSPNAPSIMNKSINNIVDLTENDKPGFLVTQILAVDEDNDQLWFNISGGNEENHFYIGRDSGNVLLSKYLDYETVTSYNLTISVTDGSNIVYTWLFIQVVDTNDNAPQFTKEIYHVNISENIDEESVIMQLHATDRDEDKKLFYHLHATQDPSSLTLFRIDSISGNVIVTQKLDFEKTSQHILIAFVKDQGTPGKRNYAKIIVNVHDHNDHYPEFTRKIIQSKAPESAAIGSKLVQVTAIDRDSGQNAEIHYSIITGNVGSMFEIDPKFGIVYLAASLDINKMQEYMLQIKAVDLGHPPLSSQVPVHIIVTMSDNDPPKFFNNFVSLEMFENLGIGSFVTQVEARSSSSVFFDIIAGNVNESFRINPSTGVIVINSNVDYEINRMFNLTIKGTNMASAFSHQNVIVHVLDVNDNVPKFLQTEYIGTLSESANLGSYVQKVDEKKRHLTVNAFDADVGLNGMLQYKILDDLAKNVFKIDSTTGAIEILRSLDYEKKSNYSFFVTVSDMGKPSLHSTTKAHVVILVTNVNDCPPVFKDRDLNVTLFLPTFENVFVAHIGAIDADNDVIRYDIVDGNNPECFEIHPLTGVLTTRNAEFLNSEYNLHVRASDGLYSTILLVNIHIEAIVNSNFVFQKKIYEFSAFENTTKVTTIGLINVIGNALNENVEYRILNPTEMFTIGITSGAIKTTGIIFDRETQDMYKLYFEAKSTVFSGDNISTRRALTSVYISVLDINDNCPMFVNMPYYASVSVGFTKGTIILKVKAIDLDSAENGEVRYELKKGNGELFKIDRKTGELSIKQTIEGHNRKYDLTVAACDGAVISCCTEVPVQIKVIDRSMPVFEKQFYSVSVKEDVEMYSALFISIQAESPLKRKLIYTISSDDSEQYFEIDYRTGSLCVVNELDYEEKNAHEISIRATDSISGIYADVLLSITVIDVNDCYPEIESDNYNITLPENTPFGSQILQINATDLDSGANGKLSYFIESIDGRNDSDTFYIDVSEGSLYLKTPLDYELKRYHHVVVHVKDHGSTPLTSKCNVFITVKDLNDNSPQFIEPSFNTKLSVAATRGQFVALPRAFDNDTSDIDFLQYQIVDGNDLQTYSIEKQTGVISLQNMLNFTDKPNTILNISISDGVHTSFARLKITLVPENVHSPQFENIVYKATIMENLAHGHEVITVKAVDDDFGQYASLYYEIVSEEMKQYFEINRNTGLITSKVSFDREIKDEYVLQLKAIDGGSKFGFASLRVTIEDANDNSPHFFLKEYRMVVSSSNNPNETILTVNAMDKDLNANGVVKYTIVPHSMEPNLRNKIHLNESNGDIVLISDPKHFEKGVFQFFIRAFDSGETSLHTDIPVTLEIVDSDVIIPTFEKKDINLKVIESTSPGTVLTKLHVYGNYSLKLSISEESSIFAISENGELILMQTLDREQNDSHYLVIVAETATLPVLFAYAEVYIHVTDENDNYPKFDNTIYSCEVAENTEKVASILKVTATDADTGSNGDVRYYFDEESNGIRSIFDIDIYTGWITLLSSLDREVQSEYNLKVIATDNGHPKHDSKVPVSIKIIDYNDNGPQFKLPMDHIYISETALPGTVLVNLLLIDPDIEKQTLDYYIISGDRQSQFQIGKTGELFISRPLDREEVSFYNLSILATDGKFTTESNVHVHIKDVNDNMPYCLKPRYHITVDESTPIGSTIVEVKAIDLDSSDFKLRYYMSGKGSDDFVIGKDSGVLKVAKTLDREKIAKYKLYAHVQDGKEFIRECVSEIIITVNDINDNAPIFSLTNYRVSIQEDAQLQTLVTKVHATDKDFGMNRKIKYSLTGTNSDYFGISKSTGIIKLEKNLDRETISLYNFTVKVEDFGKPILSSVANIVINILDINDNPPEFSLRQYKSHMYENVTRGSEVCKIHATSKDIGVNAEILYYIISGNEQQKFNINSSTGVLWVNGTVDYEKSKFYFLTVQAIDGGSPPFSNIAYVNITIEDVNDNTPTFTQNIYRTSVREDISVNLPIIDVKATDEDSNLNGIIKYNIVKGDSLSQFRINHSNGTISLARPLDRETISDYVLEVQACDFGIPERCNSVQVNICILDANDNAPIFSQTNYSIVLQENRPLGYVFIKFDVSDADEEPNSTPYTYDIRSGNEGGLFRLEQDGSLSTASRFNHKLRDEFIIQIRVFDNGTPPQYSDTWVTIKIIEESQYPPILTPLDITVNSFEDEFASAFLGKVYASDQDQYDELTFSLATTIEETYETSKLFRITNKSGEIYSISNLDIGLYKLNVSVTDGKFTVYTTVKINVELISTNMVREATVIRFSKIAASDFLLSHRKGFIRAIRNVMRCRQKDVILISLQVQVPNSLEKRVKRSTDLNLNVVFAVRKQQIIPSSDEFFSSDEIRLSVISKELEIENDTNLIIEEIFSSYCQNKVNTCVHGVCKQFISLEQNNITTIYTDVISFAAPSYSLINKCVCKPGFDGKDCNETVNACSSEPCPPQRNCLPSESETRYQCVCPKGYSGSFCEIKSSKCVNGSCDAFSSTAVSFGGKSYAHYKINKAKAKNILENQFAYSLQIRTVQQSGTLLYASGKVDYNVLELVNGAVKYKFDLGSGEGVVSVSSIYISDGAWHTITLERTLNSAKLTVDHKHVSQGSAPGVNGILNIQSNDIFVGAEVRPHPSIIGYEDIQRGFIGCMANIKIALEPLPLYISGGSTIAALKRFTNVEFKCDPANVLVNLGVCGTQPCLNSGICMDMGNNIFKCICHARFSGELCEIDLDPCSSAPCLFGGRCDNHEPNNYTCNCPIHLSGRRCEYGKFCTPNPCKNGGICEEGDGVSHCMCRGFTGANCEIDVNECENQPCGNGATCINEAGSFRCICPSFLTGASCGDPLYSNSISTKLKNFSMEHISGIISGIAIVLIIIIILLCCFAFKRKSSISTRNRNEKFKNKHSVKQANLNSLLDKDNLCKSNAKISNLEISQRPISYSPPINDSLFISNTTFVNNLDILRSYGSAGDDLENIPFEYQKVNRTNQHVNINASNLIDGDNGGHKQEWCEQMHLKTFNENKLNNERRIDYGFPINRLSSGKLIQVAMPNVCHSTSNANFVDSSVGNGQYHWDCSDWVRKSQNPLPDITEVPGAEIADSSSFHSNDSNESKSKRKYLVHVEDIDPTRDIVALNEDMVFEYVDSEIESCIQPFMPNLNNESRSRLSSFNKSENEDYKLNTGKVYLRHPDSYLPTIHTPSDTEAESSNTEAPMLKKDLSSRRAISGNSEEIYLFPYAAGKTGSDSNISVRLCEIEDSELEDFLPLQGKYSSE